MRRGFHLSHPGYSRFYTHILTGILVFHGASCSSGNSTNNSANPSSLPAAPSDLARPETLPPQPGAGESAGGGESVPRSEAGVSTPGSGSGVMPSPVASSSGSSSPISSPLPGGGLPSSIPSLIPGPSPFPSTSGRPSSVRPTPLRVTSIAAGFNHSCAVVSGQVRCLGNNEFAQLGNGSLLDSDEPVTVGGRLIRATQVAGGDALSCAIFNGKVHCWGRDHLGLLGAEMGSYNRFYIPERIYGDETFNASQLVLSKSHLCWIGEMGEFRKITRRGVFCFGTHRSGELGRTLLGLRTEDSDGGALGPIFSEPSSDLAPSLVLEGEITSVAAGHAHSCAVREGKVYCWGSRLRGQLGRGEVSSTGRLDPEEVTGLRGRASQVAAGGEHTCAIVNGALFCWGANTYGQLGNGTYRDSAVPVAVRGMSSGVVFVSAGESHTCALLRAQASGREAQRIILKCWGLNSSGQLGAACCTSRDGNPGCSLPFLVEWSGDGNLTQVSAGKAHTCAISSERAYCWGRSVEGQLGIDWPDAVPRFPMSTPVQVRFDPR